MNRGKGSFTRKRIGGQHGYTIVEVLIFLAVSALLFGSTMTLLSGRQQRVQFTNAVRDFETKVTDVANDVSNGYYQSAGDVKCETASLTLSNSGTQGSNKDCIILGRVIKLGFDGNTQQYGIYSIIGKRLNAAGNDVSTLAEATPKLLWTGSDSLREKNNLTYGATIECVKYNGGACASGNAAFAFVTRLSGGAKLNSAGGAVTADTYVLPTINVSTDETVFVGTSLGGLTPLTSNSLTFCLKSGGTDQLAYVTLQNGRVTSTVEEGTVCS